MRDNVYMKLALELAAKGYSFGEIPVGAVLVCGNEVVAWAFNEKELRKDATAHAELLTLQRASQHLKRWRFTDCALYSTLEPCVMCAGAMVNARLGKLVYGTRDPKAGAAGSIINVLSCPELNHQVEVAEGVLKEECGDLLKQFFQDLRRDGRVGRRRSTRNRVDG